VEILNLKNYGVSVAEAGNKVPKEIQREVKGYLIRKLLHSMGLLGMLRFFINVKKEKKRIAQHSFKVLNKSDILVSGFTRDRINAAAMFSALSKALGQEKALGMQLEMIERFGYSLMSSIAPTAADLKACGNSFLAFKAYMKACNKANASVGVHEIEEIEDSEDCYRFNVTYCAYHSIPDEVGLGATCLPSCYADDVFFSKYCSQIGAEFKREGTIARGNKVCDFCFIDSSKTPTVDS
jgi:hypothetical protein